MGALYLVSRQGAPHGKVLRLAAGDYALAHAAVLVPESDGVLEGGGEFGGAPLAIASGWHLHAGADRRAFAALAHYTLKGERLADLPLPDVADVAEVVPVGGPQVLYSVATYVRPPYFERFDGATGKASESKLAETAIETFDDATVARVFATSKDGTRRADEHHFADGHEAGWAKSDLAVWLWRFIASARRLRSWAARGRLWLDGHGVLAFANLRGGGRVWRSVACAGRADAQAERVR